MSEERRNFIKKLKSGNKNRPVRDFLDLKPEVNRAHAASIQAEAGPVSRSIFIDALGKLAKRRGLDRIFALRSNNKPETAGFKNVDTKPVLHIGSVEDWLSVKRALLNIEPLRNAARQTEMADGFLRTLAAFEKAIGREFGRPPEEIDEDSSEEMAGKIMKLLGGSLGRMLERLDRPTDSQDIANMAKTLDTYFRSLYIEKHELDSSATAADWIDLDMLGDDMLPTSTADPAKKGRIHQIYIQPRLIRFLNSFGEKSEQYFLGKCCVYKLKS